MIRKIIVLFMLSVSVLTMQAQTPKYYAIMARADNASFSITLNGISVCDSAGYFQGEMNSYLLPGTNEVAVKMLWHKDSVSTDTPSLEVNLYLVGKDGFKEEKRYVDITLPKEFDTTKPLVLKQSFTIPFVENLLLSKAEPVTALTDTDKQAMIAQVDELKKAILAKDVDKMCALLQSSLEDIDRAGYKTFDIKEWKADTQDMMSGKITLADNATAPKFEIMGNLVRLSYFDDGPGPSAIQFVVDDKGEQNNWYMSFYFGKIDGRWIILR